MSAITTREDLGFNGSIPNITINESQQQDTSNCVSFFLFVFLFLIPVGTIVNYKLFKNVKKEEKGEKGKVIQKIMKTYTIIQTVGWPFISCVVIVLSIENMSYRVIDPWLHLYLLDTLRVLGTCLRMYVGFNSLIVSVCRYCFIVHDAKVSKYGIEKTGKILICLSFCVPLVTSILWCTFVNGADVLAPMSEYKQIPAFLNNSYKLTTRSTYRIRETPIYNLLHIHIPYSLHYGMVILSYGLVLLILSNLIEGVLYLHLFIYAGR